MEYTTGTEAACTRVQSFGTFEVFIRQNDLNLIFLQCQYIVKRTGNEIKENDEQETCVLIQYHLLKGQDPFRDQERKVVVDIDNFDIKICLTNPHH